MAALDLRMAALLAAWNEFCAHEVTPTEVVALLSSGDFADHWQSLPTTTLREIASCLDSAVSARAHNSTCIAAIQAAIALVNAASPDSDDNDSNSDSDYSSSNEDVSEHSQHSQSNSDSDDRDSHRRQRRLSRHEARTDRQRRHQAERQRREHRRRDRRGARAADAARDLIHRAPTMSGIRNSGSRNRRSSRSGSDTDTDASDSQQSVTGASIPRPSSSDPTAGMVETCQRWLNRYQKTLSEYCLFYANTIGWKQRRNRYEAEMNALYYDVINTESIAELKHRFLSRFVAMLKFDETNNVGVIEMIQGSDLHMVPATYDRRLKKALVQTTVTARPDSYVTSQSSSAFPSRGRGSFKGGRGGASSASTNSHTANSRGTANDNSGPAVA